MCGKPSNLLCEDRLSTIFPRQRLASRILARLQVYEKAGNAAALNDEQVWTMLFSYGYVCCDGGHLGLLASVLTERDCGEGAGPPPGSRAWLEMLPMAARLGKAGESESNSEIDLMLGDISLRQGCRSGVAYEPSGDGRGWVCFVEAKWLSDIAARTKHDPHRNQLARVIEAAAVFQGQRQLPKKVQVTLLTPACFKNDAGLSGTRLYAYKFHEYQQDREHLIKDVNSAKIPPRRTATWAYPDGTDQRLRNLSLHWVTYESVLAAMPDSEYKVVLCQFVKDRARLLRAR